MLEQEYFFIIPIIGSAAIFITISYFFPHSIEINLAVLALVSGIYGIKHIMESGGYIRKAKKIIPVYSKVRLFGRSRQRIKK